jgi:mannan endo-1,4-beta-mannosidase
LIKVVCTYHRYQGLGTDDVNEVLNAASWWVKNYNTLKSAGDFTLNMINEWGSHNQNADSFSSAYNQVEAPQLFFPLPPPC